MEDRTKFTIQLLHFKSTYPLWWQWKVSKLSKIQGSKKHPIRVVEHEGTTYAVLPSLLIMLPIIEDYDLVEPYQMNIETDSYETMTFFKAIARLFRIKK